MLTSLPRRDAFFAADQSHQLPLPHTLAGNRFLFLADDGPHGVEAWVTDGTVKGTHLLRDICPGIYDAEHGLELWQSDGTAAGTRLAVELEPGSGYAISNLLVSTPGRGLWVTDGTAAGTRNIGGTAVQPSFDLFPQWAVFEGRLYYIGASEDSQFVVHVSVGTEAGTGPLLDRDGMEIAAPQRFAVLGDRLLFTAGDPVALWESDGTPEGTFRLLPEIGGTGELVRAGSRVFFPAYSREDGVELWAVEDPIQ